MPAATPIARHAGTGKMVSHRNASGDPACSKAASDWRLRKATRDTFVQLAACRRSAASHRSRALKEASGKIAPGRETPPRMERAASLKAQHAAKVAKATKAAPASPAHAEAHRRLEYDAQTVARMPEGLGKRLAQAAIEDRRKRLGLGETPAPSAPSPAPSFSLRPANAGKPSAPSLFGKPEGPASTIGGQAPSPAPAPSKPESTPAPFSLKQETAAGRKAAPGFFDTATRQGKLLDVKAGDLPGQTSLLEQVPSVETHPAPSPKDQAAAARAKKGDAESRRLALLARITRKQLGLVNDRVGNLKKPPAERDAAEARIAARGSALERRKQRLAGEETPKAEPKPEPAKADPLADVPESVRSHVRGALRSIRERVEAQRRAAALARNPLVGGERRYLDEVREKEAAGARKDAADVREFRRLAKENGVDPKAAVGALASEAGIARPKGDMLEGLRSTKPANAREILARAKGTPPAAPATQPAPAPAKAEGRGTPERLDQAKYRRVVRESLHRGRILAASGDFAHRNPGLGARPGDDVAHLDNRSLHGRVIARDPADPERLIVRRPDGYTFKANQGTLGLPRPRMEGRHTPERLARAKELREGRAAKPASSPKPPASTASELPGGTRPAMSPEQVSKAVAEVRAAKGLPPLGKSGASPIGDTRPAPKPPRTPDQRAEALARLAGKLQRHREKLARKAATPGNPLHNKNVEVFGRGRQIAEAGRRVADQLGEHIRSKGGIPPRPAPPIDRPAMDAIHAEIRALRAAPDAGRIAGLRERMDRTVNNWEAEHLVRRALGTHTEKTLPNDRGARLDAIASHLKSLLPAGAWEAHERAAAAKKQAASDWQAKGRAAVEAERARAHEDATRALDFGPAQKGKRKALAELEAREKAATFGPAPATTTARPPRALEPGGPPLFGSHYTEAAFRALNGMPPAPGHGPKKPLTQHRPRA